MSGPFGDTPGLRSNIVYNEYGEIIGVFHVMRKQPSFTAE